MESIPNHVEEMSEYSPEKLPEIIDRDTTIFAYGHLLDIKNLRELLSKKREKVEIVEAIDFNEAAKLASEQPETVVILRGVKLEGVRVSISTEKEIRDLYKQEGQSEAKLIEKGLLEPTPRNNAYLYARVAKEGEHGRFLNGGLVLGLTKDELSMLDEYELYPIYKREKTPELIIDKKQFHPENITFYAGSGPLNRTGEEAVRAIKLAKEDRDGDDPYGPNAKWPHSVRKK